MAKFIAKASEKKYRYIGRKERIPAAHFGEIQDWNKFAPLKETLEQKALDASDVASNEITSDEDIVNEPLERSKADVRTREILDKIDKKVERSNQRKQSMLGGI